MRLLNDRFGVQVRGGCSCAGTYGHYLLHVDPNRSHRITEKIDQGDLSEKPGWVRMSLHPTTTTAEVHTLAAAVRSCVEHAEAWGTDYRYSPNTNEFTHLSGTRACRTSSLVPAAALDPGSDVAGFGGRADQAVLVRLDGRSATVE